MRVHVLDHLYTCVHSFIQGCELKPYLFICTHQMGHAYACILSLQLSLCMYVHVHVNMCLENKCGSVCVHVFTLDLLCRAHM